ncbi:Tat-linked quality control protein, partial [Operophtera brumata]
MFLNRRPKNHGHGHVSKEQRHVDGAARDSERARVRGGRRVRPQLQQGVLGATGPAGRVQTTGIVSMIEDDMWTELHEIASAPECVAEDLLKILDEFSARLPPVVIHSFTGSSDGGIRRLLSEGILPLDKLLVETDSPFISMNFVNRYCTFQRNEPCALPAIVELVAGFLGQSPADVALATAFNALKLFGLS